jgi:hydrogenase maturation protease
MNDVSQRIAFWQAASGPKRKCVVLGIGNSLMCEDGVGTRLVGDLSRVCHHFSQSSEIEFDFIDGGTLGYLLLDRIAGADLILVLDAANIGEAPGAFRLLEGETLHQFLSGGNNRSVHELGLIDLLQMLDFTPEKPKELALIGIQPERLGWGDALSPAIEAQIPEIISFATCFIDSWSQRTAPTEATVELEGSQA